MIKKTQSGSGLIEVVVAGAIMSLVAITFFGTFGTLSRFHERETLAIKGQLLAEEGIESVRLIKSSGWSNLSNIPSGEEIIDGIFYRSFNISGVSRDYSDSIVSSGGTIDPNTLLVEVKVSWPWRGATSTVMYETYVTNI